MLNFIAAYKDKSGRDIYRAFQVNGTSNPAYAAKHIGSLLQGDGFTVVVIGNIIGTYTMEELQAIADSPIPPPVAVRYFLP